MTGRADPGKRSLPKQSDRISAELAVEDLIAEDTPAQAPYARDEMVRVSIVPEAPSVIDKGYALEGLSTNSAATAYRTGLETLQARVESHISTKALGGQPPDVQWKLTLAANLISANVPCGTIEAIDAIDGVRAVYVETRYEISEPEVAEPDSATSGATMGGYELASELGLNSGTVFRDLNNLATAQLITRDVRGRRSVYSTNMDMLRRLMRRTLKVVNPDEPEP